MTVISLPTHPAWCDLEHADEVHRSVLWTEENFDTKRVEVSLIDYDAAVGADYSGLPEVSLTVVDPEDPEHHSIELWLSPVMVGTLVAQLTNALVEVAGVTR